MTAKHMPKVFESWPKLREIVDFAVERKDEVSIMRQHRLAARCGEIDDSKAAMAKGDSRLVVEPESAVIRSAMPQCCCHPLDRSESLRIGTISDKDTDDPAHPISLRLELRRYALRWCP
jgi:hypothetical protein